jgi:hypothetical protein
MQMQICFRCSNHLMETQIYVIAKIIHIDTYFHYIKCVFDNKRNNINGYIELYYQIEMDLKMTLIEKKLLHEFCDKNHYNCIIDTKFNFNVCFFRKI